MKKYFSEKISKKSIFRSQKCSDANFCLFFQIEFFAPRLFFELAKTTQHDFWSATQRGADYAEALETCRCTYKAEYASGPVPKPVRCRYRWHLASEPEIFGNATGSCVEVVPKRVQMCVCSFVVAFYSFLNNSSQNGNNADPHPPSILDWPISKLKKTCGAPPASGCILVET